MLDQATNAILNDQRLPEHSKFWTSGILCKVTCKILDLIWLGQITVCSYHLWASVSGLDPWIHYITYFSMYDS